jgi:hypothetical protein
MPRTTSSNNPSDVMNTVHTAPYIPFVCCHATPTYASVLLCRTMSFMLFFFFIYHGVTFFAASPTCDHLMTRKRSRPIWPKLAGSKPAIAVRGEVFVFGSGVHTPVLPHVFRCLQTGILWAGYCTVVLVTLSGTTKDLVLSPGAQPCYWQEQLVEGDMAWVEFEELRHPALALRTKSDFIPNDVKLGETVGRISLLTGLYSTSACSRINSLSVFM